jgi:shikimate dehydrogenase
VTSNPKAFVVGWPIKHSRSPLIHRHWLDRNGLTGSYERVAVAPEDFARFITGLGEQGFAGGNVTVPHKEAAFRLAEIRTDCAQRLQAANTLWFEDGRLHADNTDVAGFIASLDAALGARWSEGALTALVLGAGGAARAVIAGLLDRGLEVMLTNRSPERAEELRLFDPCRVTTLAWAEIPHALRRTDLLVNTTSLGMAGQPPLEIDLTPLPPSAIVTDIVYVPLETELLAAARRRSLRAVDGLGMLLHQAVPGFARWFGVTPEVTPELRALVAADIEAHG